MVVNFCGAAPPGTAQWNGCVPVPEEGVVVAVDPAARCCHKNAPTTIIISNTGIAILVIIRVRVFIIIASFH